MKKELIELRNLNEKTNLLNNKNFSALYQQLKNRNCNLSINDYEKNNSLDDLKSFALNLFPDRTKHILFFQGTDGEFKILIRNTLLKMKKIDSEKAGKKSIHLPERVPLRKNKCAPFQVLFGVLSISSFLVGLIFITIGYGAYAHDKSSHNKQDREDLSTDKGIGEVGLWTSGLSFFLFLSIFCSVFKVEKIPLLIANAISNHRKFGATFKENPSNFNIDNTPRALQQV